METDTQELAILDALSDFVVRVALCFARSQPTTERRMEYLAMVGVHIEEKLIAAAEELRGEAEKQGSPGRMAGA